MYLEGILELERVEPARCRRNGRLLCYHSWLRADRLLRQMQNLHPTGACVGLGSSLATPTSSFQTPLSTRFLLLLSTRAACVLLRCDEVSLKAPSSGGRPEGVAAAAAGERPLWTCWLMCAGRSGASCAAAGPRHSGLQLCRASCWTPWWPPVPSLQTFVLAGCTCMQRVKESATSLIFTSGCGFGRANL